MFFERLKQCCKEKGVTLASLCEVLDTNTGTIGGWRKGASPNSSFVIKLAKYFEVSADYLLGLVDNPHSYQDNEAGRLELTLDEAFLIERLREQPLDLRMKIMTSCLVLMGGNPDRDKLPSLRIGEQKSGAGLPTEENEDGAVADAFL